MAYSMEFRIEVAEEKGCIESWVRRLIQVHTQTGSLKPKTPDRSGTRKLNDDDLEQLRKLIKDKADMTLGELAKAMGHKASVPTIWRAAEQLKLTRKKTTHAAEQDRPDVEEKRDNWFDGRDAAAACFSR